MCLLGNSSFRFLHLQKDVFAHSSLLIAQANQDWTKDICENQDMSISDWKPNACCLQQANICLEYNQTNITSFLVPAKERNFHSIMLLPPCFTARKCWRWCTVYIFCHVCKTKSSTMICLLLWQTSEETTKLKFNFN